MPCQETIITPLSPSSFTLLSKCSVFPSHKSTTPDLKLSVSDLPMLSCHYIQKGCLFTLPPFPYPRTHYSIQAKPLNNLNSLPPSLRPPLSYEGHFMPILAVQVTEFVDGVFISCSVNHAVTDGTSFWDFFNTFSGINRGLKKLSTHPDFSRDSVLVSPVVLRVPEGGPKVAFDVHAPINERIFSFSREAILKLKGKVNGKKCFGDNGDIDVVELMGKQSNDPFRFSDGKLTPLRSRNGTNASISSFQSLSALLWRGITRARKFCDTKMTTFRMAVNCRHRLEPKLEPHYFGNAIQSIPTYAQAGEVLKKDLRWCAEQLNKNVMAHDNKKVRSYIDNWEQDPRCFPLGNFDGAMITMGSSPRFPMYNNDFGWGRPVAVRSGKANKFDGKISAFPGRKGGGSVDLEVVLAPETMARLESDPEFMEFVTQC
ncbi:hypothetical protein LIER_19003 [Lithospermum erythrorhizon]|uniref:Uncharacterized protein n=1 Tax=Lithospermum erythrorhizon TaxID=34254 RepID=A0AAV3QLI6_LITER